MPAKLVNSTRATAPTKSVMRAPQRDDPTEALVSLARTHFKRLRDSFAPPSELVFVVDGVPVSVAASNIPLRALPPSMKLSRSSPTPNIAAASPSGQLVSEFMQMLTQLVDRLRKADYLCCYPPRS
jgi:hypothetical protein